VQRWTSIDLRLAQRHNRPQIRRVLAATAAVEWIDAIDIEEAITVEC
jgi:hypothetical protein